jgi:guanosine-3',5'-bis(diphosphate) 3'-pyrophosphohydrolase
MHATSTLGTGQFLDALNFVAVRHRSQRRKGRAGAPYINHLIEVAWILTQHGVDDIDVLCAALLHDAVEDAGVNESEIRKRFGARVAGMVRMLTDDDSKMLADRKQEQVDLSGTLPPEVQDIRIADKISNLRGILTSPPENWSLARKQTYYRWAQAVVRECTEGRPSKRSSIPALPPLRSPVIGRSR